MQALTESDLLELWEAGAGRTAAAKALLLLTIAEPGLGRDDLLDLSIGARDLRLGGLREVLFGPVIAGTCRCPACDEALEVSFALSDLLARECGAVPGLIELSLSGYQVSCRPATGRDLAAAGSAGDLEAARASLVSACVVSAESDGLAVKVTDLPDDVLLAVGEAMDAADPGANIELLLRCDGCGTASTAALDLASFLWTELGAWARRTLREVHELAAAYGWPEPAVLALSQQRRRAYLELVRDG
jgi:hypothetical protein